MRGLIIICFVLTKCLSSFAQDENQLYCDSLVNKPFSFLFDEAKQVVLAKIQVHKEERNLFTADVLYTYKGYQKEIKFAQKKKQPAMV